MFFIFFYAKNTIYFLVSLLAGMVILGKNPVGK
jgi:hypothetical protein